MLQKFRMTSGQIDWWHTRPAGDRVHEAMQEIWMNTSVDVAETRGVQTRRLSRICLCASSHVYTEARRIRNAIDGYLHRNEGTSESRCKATWTGVSAIYKMRHIFPGYAHLEKTDT